MPLYNYRCRECETDFEVRQSFSEDPITDCPTCQAEDTVYRVIQPAGVVFKGSGFYITDTKASRDSLTGTSNGNGHSNGNGNGKKESSDNGSDSKSTVTPPPAKSSDGASASASPAN